MSKIALITKHEFLAVVRRKSFVIMTLLFPVIALIAMGAFQLIQNLGDDTEEIQAIGYIDEIGIFTDDTDQSNIVLVYYDSEDEAQSALTDGDIKEYFIIPEEYVTTGLISRFTLERELEAPGETIWVMKSFLLGNLLKGETSQEIAERVKNPMWLQTTRLTETGEIASEQGGFESFLVPYIFGILLLIAIFTSSGYLLQGLGEEKENRIMEILLSSVSPRQLITGKVIGLGAAGLVQILVWLVSAPLLVQLASSTIGGFISQIQIPTNFLALGIVYFILGYLIYAVLMAGVGSISPTAREGQQMSVLFTLFGVAPFWFMPLLMQHPEHVLAKILTIFPLTAPLSVMLRLGLADIEVWELVTSICLLIISIIVGLWLSAKVFRTYLLMYGKRPNLREIVKSIRSA